MYSLYFRTRINRLAIWICVLLDNLCNWPGEKELIDIRNNVNARSIKYRVDRCAYYHWARFGNGTTLRKALERLVEMDPGAVSYIPAVTAETCLTKPDYVDYADIVNRLLTICDNVIADNAAADEVVVALRRECSLVLNHCDRSPRCYVITWGELPNTPNTNTPNTNPPNTNTTITCIWDGESESYVLSQHVIHAGDRVTGTIEPCGGLWWHSDGYKYAVGIKYDPRINNVCLNAHVGYLGEEKTRVKGVVTKVADTVDIKRI